MTGARSLNGKTAIVTGAAQGIGRAIAELFAQEGASVMIADIQLGKAEAVANELRASGLRASAVLVDITQPDSAVAMAEHTIAEFGHIDFLVNNAGIDAPRGKAVEIDEAHWRMVIDTDLSGSWWCTKAVLPHMRERKTGRIIFISSIAARLAEDASVAYNAAKAGLVGLTIGLANQVEQYGILVNAIAPGAIGTGEPMTPEEIREDEARYPLRIVGPRPVANACLYLVGEGGDWMSGSVLNVSGGRWRGY
jgi:NAD(P)-dependent dehydrogenase (short-subunit alcohol dehydrogenase family)